MVRETHYKQSARYRNPMWCVDGWRRGASAHDDENVGPSAPAKMKV